ncbi:hypothetical protein quinque_010982 [Culex quinquefasciatus]
MLENSTPNRGGSQLIMQRIVAILFVLAVVQRINAQTDYCDRSLCKNNQPHVACGKTNNYGPFCPVNRELVILSEDTKSTS